jgi:hypothetical protein
LFIPSNYHNKAPISQNKEWVEWLKSKKYFELAAHGHYHACERTDIGECEFFELDTPAKASDRLDALFAEWNAAGHLPTGWRNPGWLGHPAAVQELGKRFQYAAIHYEHNHNLPWECKTFYGHDGIHTVDIKVHNQNMLMFQSHIAGDWNDNTWNEANYQQMKLSLQYLTQNNTINFKTLSECL